LDILGRLPIDPQIAARCDAGQVELLAEPYLTKAVEKIKNL